MCTMVSGIAKVVSAPESTLPALKVITTPLVGTDTMGSPTHPTSSVIPSIDATAFLLARASAMTYTGISSSSPLPMWLLAEDVPTRIGPWPQDDEHRPKVRCSVRSSVHTLGDDELRAGPPCAQGKHHAHSLHRRAAATAGGTLVRLAASVAVPEIDGQHVRRDAAGRSLDGAGSPASSGCEAEPRRDVRLAGASAATGQGRQEWRRREIRSESVRHLVRAVDRHRAGGALALR